MQVSFDWAMVRLVVTHLALCHPAFSNMQYTSFAEVNATASEVSYGTASPIISTRTPRVLFFAGPVLTSRMRAPKAAVLAHVHGTQTHLRPQCAPACIPDACRL